jgi:hypothetical protein
MSGSVEAAIRGTELTIGKMFRVRYARWRAGEYAVMENLHETNWNCQYNGAVSASGIFYPRSSRPGPARETAKAGTTC